MIKRILVIDDDELVLDSVGALLKSKGYEAQTARNAIDALDLLDREVFGLVLCDIRMPGINGFETIKSLRLTSQKLERENPNESVAVIFMSAYSDKKLRAEAEKYSPVAYLVKPFEDNILLGLTKEVFEHLADQAKSKAGKSKS